MDATMKTSAFHENAAKFGPCEGPTAPEKGASWFCQGTGTERLDPASREFDDAILCYPCFSMREANYQPELTDAFGRVLCGHCDAMAPMATCLCADAEVTE